MPAFCCVFNCGSRGERDNVKFYRIPKALNFKHKTELNNLSSERRFRWINAIKRKNFTKSKLKNARICSKHFITGVPAKLCDSTNPDWIPSQHMGYKTSFQQSTSNI
ncbi:hypothetical protein FQR65_LT17467 [Abscondita terminalis]|nr:hypothetical protein FQR65_LT17467 [Abscondita terminalis]